MDPAASPGRPTVSGKEMVKHCKCLTTQDGVGMNEKDSIAIGFWFTRIRNHNAGVDVLSREDLIKAKVSIGEILRGIWSDIAVAKSRAAASGVYLKPDVYEALLTVRSQYAKLNALVDAALADEKKRRKIAHEQNAAAVSEEVAQKEAFFARFFQAAKQHLPEDVFERVCFYAES